MQIRELSKPMTSKVLNENLAKQFGYKLNLEGFTTNQLRDAQNKLRTKISQFELGESYDSIHESPEYQKTRVMLDCINTELIEREEGKCPKCHKEPCECVEEGTDAEAGENAAKKAEMQKKLKASRLKEKATEHSVPETWIDSAIERIELGESDEEELVAELTTRYDLSESTATRIVYLSEGESEKAEVIMATKDMVDRVTGWIEDVAAMKSEQLLELLDSIREHLGNDVAQAYSNSVKPALEAIYTALESSRTGLSTGLAAVSGDASAGMMGEPTPDMGADAGMPPADGMGAEPGADAGMPPEAGAEPGAEATPPEGAAGREKRESVDYSRRLGMLLAASKKK